MIPRRGAPQIARTRGRRGCDHGRSGHHDHRQTQQQPHAPTTTTVRTRAPIPAPPPVPTPAPTFSPMLTYVFPHSRFFSPSLSQSYFFFLLCLAWTVATAAAAVRGTKVRLAEASGDHDRTGHKDHCRNNNAYHILDRHPLFDSKQGSSASDLSPGTGAHGGGASGQEITLLHGLGREITLLHSDPL